MIVTFYNNKSPNNSIDKNLEVITQYNNAIIKDTDDLYNLTMIVTNREHLQDANYFYVTGLNRYYYIDSYNLENQRLIITGHVDVLQTYRQQIEKCKIVVERNEKQYNAYINDSDFVVEERVDKWVKAFPNRELFNNSRNFIMITAGGVG